MGMKIQCESYVPGFLSMRELNEDSNSCGWSPYYGDRVFATRQHYFNGFTARRVMDCPTGHDKDILKRKMLEHEAIFKNQVYELHRLYRIQRDMMEEVRKKGLHGNQIPMGTTLTSNPLVSQAPSGGCRKWHASGLPVVNTMTGRSTLCVEDVNSALSSMKSGDMQLSSFSSQNGFVPKDIEIPEPRPTKVRRKMFDLQLPAEEYICTEEDEKLRDELSSDAARCVPIGDCNRTSVKPPSPFYCNETSIKFHGNSARSESHNRIKACVADLNQPIEIEDTDVRVHSDFTGHTTAHHQEVSRENPEVLEFLDKASAPHAQTWENGSLNGAHPQKSINGRHWFSNMRDTAEVHGKSNLSVVEYPIEQLSVSYHSTQGLCKQSKRFTGYPKSDDYTRDKFGFSLPSTDWYKGKPNGNHQDSGNIAYPCSASSPSLVKSWPNPLSCLEKVEHKSSHKLLQPSAPMDRSPRSPNLGHGFFGERWGGGSSIESRFGRELPARNGFCRGSQSGAKEPPVHIFCNGPDHPNSTASAHQSSELLACNSPGKSRSIISSVTAVKDVNLKSVFSNMASDKVGGPRNCEVVDVEKRDLTTFPWLYSKPPPKHESADLSLDLNPEKGLSRNNDFVSGRTEDEKAAIVMSGSCSNAVGAMKLESSYSPSCQRIASFSKLQGPKTQIACSSPPDGSNSRKHLMLDINLPSDATSFDHDRQIMAEIISDVKVKDVEVGNIRCLIDLNSCTNEDEAMLVPSVRCGVKIGSGIDLEASLVPEVYEDTRPEQCQEQTDINDENINMAAEIIVSISLSMDSLVPNDCYDLAMSDSLLCLADIVCSSKEDNCNNVDPSLGAKDYDCRDQIVQGLDYFESMTLNLAETKSDDYMPKPLVQENLKLNEIVATHAPCRTRRGQARRGRQRRDFQRDILPGLTSLARHEVTEDLQVFGGLMRATGHLWSSGLTRRNTAKGGSTRGRRRMMVASSRPVVLSPPCTPLIQQLNSIEVSLEDRSLTGWGKTTRRPRRQRCPATGNSTPIPLT